MDDSTVNSDTDYVAAAATGDLDLYEVGDLPITPESIHAVQVTRCARKDDAATRKVRSKVKSGGASADGAMHAMAASCRYFRDIHETDPDTAAAWMADRVAVMSAGRIVESAAVESVPVSPTADYTRELLANTASLNAASAA